MRNRYLRDAHWKIIGTYYKGHTFTTTPQYNGLLIDGVQVLSETEFNLYCSDAIARNRLSAVSRAYVDTLNK